MTEIIKIETPVITENNELLGYKYYKENSKHPYSSHLEKLLQKTENPEYLHWETVKRKSWIPPEISPESFWFIIKFFRRNKVLGVPVKTENEKFFFWQKLPRFEKLLHEIDISVGGKIIESRNFNEKQKREIITEGLIEEAIASSQIEGAHTTLEVAKKMIRENRNPADKSQRMILNNYKIMKRIEQETKNKDLSIEILLNLHIELTNGTLDSKAQEGRFRTEDEKISIGNDIDGTIAFIPPHINFVREQLNLLILYANDGFDLDEEQNNYTHPIIKAIILHFWFAYLHPFVDGNGRMARALFYWYLLKKGYWMFAYLPISTCIKKSQNQYAKAYLYTEQDDNDLTYFIDYNIRKIEQAQKHFKEFIETKKIGLSNEPELTEQFPTLNPRQIRLIQFFRAKPDERTNMSSMIQIHGISTGTAVKDLKTMEQQGLLYKRKSGLNVFYYPTDALLKDE